MKTIYQIAFDTMSCGELRCWCSINHSIIIGDNISFAAVNFSARQKSKTRPLPKE